MSDFEDILDEGNVPEPPSEAYVKALNLFDFTVRRAMKLSRACMGIQASGRKYYASVLFTTLLVRSISLLQIAPLSNWAQKVIEHWDYASASVIARTILEIRLCFYYLCVDECSDEEWQCRWETLNLNDCAHRIKIAEAVQAEDEVTDLKRVLEELVRQISNNQYFQSLSPGVQKNIEKGSVTYLKPLEEIAELVGISRNEFRFFHVFFSTHVHALPMSFYRIGEERGRGLPTEVESDYTTMCLNLAAQLLLASHAEMEQLFIEEIALNTSLTVENLQASEVLPGASELATGIEPGDVQSVYTSERIRVEAVGLPDGGISFQYYEPVTGEKVLRTHISEDELALDFVDPVYWNIEVNDEPVTDRLLYELTKYGHLFSIDVATRNLRFKVPIDVLARERKTLTSVIAEEIGSTNAKANS